MHKSYQEFDDATGFSAKAGFQLTELQKQDTETCVEWGRFLNGYEVGGGKTVVSTAVSLMWGSSVTIVVVPPILIRPWAKWLQKVSEGVLEYCGTPAQRKVMDLKTARWVIVSQAIFRDDFDRIEKELARKFPELVIDEAQSIKNPQSKLFKKVFRLSAGGNLQMLTGTPTSKPADAYSYIKLKSPDIYRSFANFANIHVAEYDHFGAVKAWQNLDVLAENFAIKTIKRTKEEIHGYKNPPIFPDCSYALAPAHQRLYERLLDEQLLLLDDGTKIDGTTAQRLYHALQQVVVNYDYFSGNPENRSVSYDLIDSVIDQTQCAKEDNSKLIIWTLYKRTSRSVLAYVNSLGIKAVGAYSEVDSNKSFASFMEDPTTRVGVFQPSSAGAGLNPQSVCWETLYIETSTTPMLSRQSIGRVDRVGQLHIPTVRFGVAENTIQTRLVSQLMANDDLVSTVERTKKSLRETLMGR